MDVYSVPPSVTVIPVISPAVRVAVAVAVVPPPSEGEMIISGAFVNPVKSERKPLPYEILEDEKVSGIAPELGVVEVMTGTWIDLMKEPAAKKGYVVAFVSSTPVTKEIFESVTELTAPEKTGAPVMDALTIFQVVVLPSEDTLN